MVVQTYENDTAAPHINLAASVERIADHQFGGSITWTSAAGLHEISATGSVSSFQAEGPYELLVAEPILDVLAELIFGIEGVGEPKVGNDDILVSVQQQVFQLCYTSNTL